MQMKALKRIEVTGVRYVVTNKRDGERKTGRPKGRKSGYTVSEKALAQRRDAVEKRKPRELITDEDFDKNSRQIEHIMKIQEIATHADKNDLVSMRSCFVAYLRLCQENGMRVGNLAAYAALGMTYVTFDLYSKRKDPAIQEFCRLVRSTCALYRESMISDGDINPVIGIFWQRNFDGLRNDTEQVQAIAESQEEDTSTAYKEKYRRLIGE